MRRTHGAKRSNERNEYLRPWKTKKKSMSVEEKKRKKKKKRREREKENKVIPVKLITLKYFVLSGKPVRLQE